MAKTWDAHNCSMRERWRQFGAVVAGYGALAVLATWPLVLHFSSHAPGSEWWRTFGIFSETPVNLWNLWWFRHALLDLKQSPFQCQYVFYPHGANLWFHTLAPFHGLLGVFLCQGSPMWSHSGSPHVEPTRR